MKLKPHQEKGKVSITFAIALTFIITASIAVVFYISSLKTPLEKRQEQSLQESALIAAEVALAYGIPLEEYNKKNQLNSDNIIHMRKIDSAITKKDNSLLLKLFKLKPNFDFKKYKPNLYQYVAWKDNEKAFLFFLNQGVDCDYSSVLGQRAFEQLLSSKYENYLNLLIDHGCDIGVNSGSIKVISALANSIYYKKVLLFPLNEISKIYYQAAFEKAILSKNTNIAIDIINKGLNPSFITKYESRSLSALSLSLLFKQTQVALHLINKGADLINESKNRYGKYELLSAVRYEQIKAIKVILKLDPDYIIREKIGDLYIETALNTHHKDLYMPVLKLAFDTGLKSQHLKNNGIGHLMNASKNSMLRVVKLLLDSGFNPNQVDNMKTVLSQAKLSQHKNAVDVIALLKQRGATDDYLAIIRKERGIILDPNCKIGQTMSITKLTKMFSKLSAYKTKKISGKPLKICYAAVALCVDSGMGTDDCIKSINVCNNPNKNRDESNLIPCCPTQIKIKYQQARCSGLMVAESFKWVSKQLYLLHGIIPQS